MEVIVDKNNELSYSKYIEKESEIAWEKALKEKHDLS
jgi:hypothetical protein